jgi:dihydrofolate reductase
MGQISLIVAHDRARGIGKDNKLPWKLPNDMKHFKKTTMGHIVVMGRKTYESIGGALDGRLNVVLSRSLPLAQKGNVVVERHFEVLLEKLKTSPRDSFIIGGMEIYRLFLQYADEVIITEIDGFFECDAFFPKLSPTNWELFYTVEGEVNENNIPHQFLYFKRRK